MVADTLWEKLKKSTGILVMCSTLAGGVAGALGGQRFQKKIDETTMTSYQRENEELKKHATHHQDGHGALEEFLLDLRSHLPANAEIESLFKAKDLHSTVDTGIGGPPADMASVQCCKEEMRRLQQLFLAGKFTSDTTVRTIGDWLDKRCSEHFVFRRQSR